MKISAVLFDLGGTLIEYAGPYDHWPELETPGLNVAYRALLDRGVDLPGFAQFQMTAFEILPERWRRATSGEQNLRLVDLLTELLALIGTGGVPETWIAEAAEGYQDAICAQATLVPGAQKTLAWIKTQGYKLGLLSNTMFTGAAHIADLERFALIDYFDALVFSADAGKWKPSPEPYLELLSSLDVPRDQAVFIGDDPLNDILGGQRAGLKTIHMRNNGRFAPADSIYPDATIDNLSELPGLLIAWSEENGRG